MFRRREEIWESLYCHREKCPDADARWDNLAGRCISSCRPGNIRSFCSVPRTIKNLTTVGFLMLDVMRVVGEGYVVVIQDSRGRYTSEGTFYTFTDDILDGYDTVEWCVVQPV